MNVNVFYPPNPPQLSLGAVPDLLILGGSLLVGAGSSVNTVVVSTRVVSVGGTSGGVFGGE